MPLFRAAAREEAKRERERCPFLIYRAAVFGGTLRESSVDTGERRSAVLMIVSAWAAVHPR